MIQKIIKYFQSAYNEMRKVIWPNRQEVTSHSLIVILTILIAMAIIAALDYGLFNLVQLLIYR